MYFWRAGDELVLFVTGRVTATEAYSMYRHVEGWLEEHPHGSVFVDLDQTNYIDSTTIGTLIRLHKQQRAAGGGFCLCNLSPAVADIIEKTKLTRYFRIIENDALHSIEHDYLERMPRHDGRDVESSFVLDAHNDICRVRPELAPKFEGLMKVLREQQEPNG
tara:strand:- start:1358 stop:1843 length:486 start_codon:yes stop_codon:yes gene_type:complete